MAPHNINNGEFTMLPINQIFTRAMATRAAQKATPSAPPTSAQSEKIKNLWKAIQDLIPENSNLKDLYRSIKQLKAVDLAVGGACIGAPIGVFKGVKAGVHDGDSTTERFLMGSALGTVGFVIGAAAGAVWPVTGPLYIYSAHVQSKKDRHHY